MKKRNNTLLGLVLLSAIGAGIGLPTVSAADATDQASSGQLEVLPPMVYPLKSPSSAITEAAKHRIHELYELGMRHPQDFGYPWIDGDTGDVVVAVTSSKGEKLARESVRGPKALGAVERVQAVARSWQDFQDIEDDIVKRNLDKSDPSLASAMRIERDGRNNRLIVTMTKLDRSALARSLGRYGVDSVAVRYDPDYQPGVLQRGGRYTDRTPFTAGAQPGCTMGMPWHWWQNGTKFTRGMLTAGHCQPNGGPVHTVEYVGAVQSGTRENWDDRFGTTLFPGQNWYAGDIALIELPPYNSHQAIMYWGDTDYVTRNIKEMWSRSSSPGDLYCTNGGSTRENCRWQVNAVHITHVYTEGGVTRWKRNVIEGGKFPPGCTLKGDSGGAVYTVRSDGGIASKGIHSGLVTMSSGYCVEHFTDIWTIYYAFGGGHPTI